MRWGRIMTIFAVATMATALWAPGALADPGTIAADLADGRLDGTYSQAELEAYLSDAMVQGYGNPVTPPVAVTPPVPLAPSAPPAPAAPTAGVAGVATPVITPAPPSATAAEQTTGVAGVQTTMDEQPLAQTNQVGSLPFTGLDLGLLVVGGFALLLLGFGARRLGQRA